MDLKFFVCRHCGNVIAYVEDSGVKVVCCGEPMQEMVPNTSDGAGEKHVPVISRKGDTVTVRVGSVEHPMLEAHYIKWIVLQTGTGVQFRELKPGDRPEADFALVPGDAPVAAFEFCNLHGLWSGK